MQNEPIEVINARLIDYFGLDTLSGLPIWRIVWSEDQFEKRLTQYTDSGLLLLTPEVRELPKYRQWIQNKWVLERLTIVPLMNSDELPSQKLSYEPTWVFEDNKGNSLPPKWEAAKFCIDTIYAAQGKSSLAKYVDEENTPDATEQRIVKLQEELFGNETETGDALAHGEAVVVPRTYGES